MSSHCIKNIEWYVDSIANQNDEPGIIHSYTSCLATAINHISKEFDPTMMMGLSGFAFRIWINETMCPSAMSIFDFSSILPQAIEQTGYECKYISRLWGEEAKEKAKREEAHLDIIENINHDRAAIVWDVKDAEWGIILGYNDDKNSYSAIASSGKKVKLKYNRLGRNGIDILSVAIPTKPNKLTKEEAIRNSLKMAVKHAEQNEWTDRPKYENGLTAYDMWAEIFNKWAMLVKAGKIKNAGADLVFFARYYSSHYASARSYARDYLRKILYIDDNLGEAAESYSNVANCLKFVWKNSPRKLNVDIDLLYSISQNIKDAKSYEQVGIDCIKRYLSRG